MAEHRMVLAIFADEAAADAAAESLMAWEKANDVMPRPVGVLALAGCSKSDKKATPARVPGMVDLTQMQEQFPNSTPEVTASLQKIRMACRYRTFDTAQAELDKLAKLPDLTDPQKKAVEEVIEQVKTAISSGAGKAAQ